MSDPDFNEALEVMQLLRDAFVRFHAFEARFPQGFVADLTPEQEARLEKVAQELKPLMERV